MGVDANGCWMGNWCQDMSLGGCPDVTMVSKRGFMEKQKAMAHRAERQFSATLDQALTTDLTMALTTAPTIMAKALDSSPIDPPLTLALTMALTVAQALTKNYTKPSNNIKWLVK